jgi:hypothetical protein
VFSAFNVAPRADACFSTFDQDGLHAVANEYGGDLRLAHVWDLPIVSFDLGLSVGAAWLRQTFTTPGYAPSRDTLAAISGGLTFDLVAGIYALADVAAETYLFRLEDSARGTSALTPSLALRTHLGIGKNW